MGTKFPEFFSMLAAEFGDDEVKLLPKGGRKIRYVTARSVMNRLDFVAGPEGWWDDYTPGDTSVLCRLTIRLPDGSTLTKADAGGYAGMADAGDDDKSGYSDALKRAAAKFGVGRYLYGDGVPEFAGEAPPRPERPAGAARDLRAALADVVAEWSRSEPVADEADAKRRRFALVNAALNAALNLPEPKFDARKIEVLNADGVPVRDQGLAWGMLKALFRLDPTWVEETLYDYVRAKLAATGNAGDRRDAALRN